MPSVAQTTFTIRASAATSGTSGQDDAVTLPFAGTGPMFVLVEKTAEANADNVLTARLQCSLDGTWYDVPFQEYWVTVAETNTTQVEPTGDPTQYAGNAIDIVNESSSPAFKALYVYHHLPSSVIRTIWIASGTTPSHTFYVKGFI